MGNDGVETRIKEVLDYATEARAEDDPRWARLFDLLSDSGLEISPENIVSESFRVGYPIELSRPQSPFISVGRLLKDIEYRGDRSEEEIVYERVETLNRVIQGVDLQEEVVARAEQTRDIITQELFPEMFEERE